MPLRVGEPGCGKDSGRGGQAPQPALAIGRERLQAGSGRKGAKP